MIHILDGQEGTILDYITAKNIIDDTHRKSLEDTLETYNFISFADRRYSEHLEKRNRIIIPDEDGSLVEFVIFEAVKYKDSEGYKAQIFANASYLELKKASILYPSTFEGTASQHGGRALNGTRWQMGRVESKDSRTLTINEHSNPYEMLKRIAKEFDLELNFRVEHDGNKITGRYVDLLERVGQWSGREVEFSKDLDGIKRVEKQDIVTALLGLGPEDENGHRLEVLVEDEEALQRWGWLDERGKLNHWIEPYEIQSERSEMTEEEARQYTRTALNKRINTQITYEATIVDLENVPGMENKKIRFGDTIKIKDTHFNPPLYLEARVFEQDRSIKSKAKKNIKLGDFIEHTEEEVHAIWKQLQKEIRIRVSRYEMLEYTYDKITIDRKDEHTFEEGKTFAEATGVQAEENAKAFAVEEDQKVKADVEQYADNAADSALDQAKMYSVAKEVYENQIEIIASDIADRAPIEYVDGQLQVVDDRLKDFNVEIEEKADKSTVYTIEDVDNMINNKVSVTQYETDINGIVTEMESHGTRIGQNTEAIGLKADKSYVDTVENSLETKIGNIEVTAEGAKITASEVRADLDDLEIGGRNYFRPSLMTDLIPAGSGIFTNYSGGKSFQFPVTSGEVYSFSRTDNTNDRFRIVFSEEEPAQGVPYASINSNDSRLKVEGIKIPEGINYVLLYLRYSSGEVPNVKIEKGNKSTDWSPAPEDTDEAIEQVSGRVKTLDGEVTTLAGEVSLKASQSEVDAIEGRVSTAEGELRVLPEMIEGKVDDGEARSIFRQEASSFTFNADQINFDGHVFGKNATFEGLIEGAEISGSHIHNVHGDSIAIMQQGGFQTRQYGGSTGPIIDIRDGRINVGHRTGDGRYTADLRLKENVMWANNEFLIEARGGVVVKNSAATEDYADLTAQFLNADAVDLNERGGARHLYLRTPPGGKIRLTEKGTTDQHIDLSARFLQADALDINPERGSSHIYIRPTSSGQVRFTASGTTNRYVDGRMGNLVLEDGEIHANNNDFFIRSEYVGSLSTYERTYSSNTQQMRVTVNGIYGRITSSRRYKLLEEPIPLDRAKKILGVDVKSWYDKRACDEYAYTLSTGAQTEVQEIRRLPGLVAEDVHDVGLTEFVEYDEDGNPDSLNENIPYLFIPILNDILERLDVVEENNLRH